MQATHGRHVPFFAALFGSWLAVSALLFLYAGWSDRHGGRSAPVATASARLEFYALDDTLPGSHGASLRYDGVWEHLRGRDDGRSNGTSTRSHQPGATATLRFRGMWFRLLGIRGPNGGLATIAIDGRGAGVANFASRDKQIGVEVFTSPLLRAGSHVVRIVTAGRGKKDPGYVNIDGATIGGE